MIFNGGNPLEGCPDNFEQADSWADKANEEKTEYEPKWSFDCGFKLDFDGPIVNVSSRFYPPKTHYGPKWDGTVTVSILWKTAIEKKFECETLDELRVEVEKYMNTLGDRISL